MLIKSRGVSRRHQSLRHLHAGRAFPRPDPRGKLSSRRFPLNLEIFYVQGLTVFGMFSPLGESMPPTTLNPRPFLTPGPFSNSTLCTVTPEKPCVVKYFITQSHFSQRLAPVGASWGSLSPSLLEVEAVCCGFDPQLHEILLLLLYSY